MALTVEPHAVGDITFDQPFRGTVDIIELPSGEWQCLLGIVKPLPVV